MKLMSVGLVVCATGLAVACGSSGSESSSGPPTPEQLRGPGAREGQEGVLLLESGDGLEEDGLEVFQRAAAGEGQRFELIDRCDPSCSGVERCLFAACRRATPDEPCGDDSRGWFEMCDACMNGEALNTCDLGEACAPGDVPCIYRESELEGSLAQFRPRGAEPLPAPFETTPEVSRGAEPHSSELRGDSEASEGAPSSSSPGAGTTRPPSL